MKRFFLLCLIFLPVCLFPNSDKKDETPEPCNQDTWIFGGSVQFGGYLENAEKTKSEIYDIGVMVEPLDWKYMSPIIHGFFRFSLTKPAVETTSFIPRLETVLFHIDTTFLQSVTHYNPQYAPSLFIEADIPFTGDKPSWGFGVYPLQIRSGDMLLSILGFTIHTDYRFTTHYESIGVFRGCFYLF